MVAPHPLLLLLPLLSLPARATLLQDSIHRQLVDPWDIRERGEEWIHLAMVITGPSAQDIEHFTNKADRMLETLVSLSRGRPVHLLFLTEAASVPTIARHVESALASTILHRLLLTSEVWKLARTRRYRIPKVRVEFVSLAAVTNRYRATIEHMKGHFNNYQDWYRIKGDPKWSWQPADKYNHDLFYLGAFYHLVFPLDRIIITDTDIEFKYSVDSLYDQFQLFSGEQLYSLGPDLTPFYADMVHDYRAANPGTPVGEPGPLQGVNTGVVLLQADRMRASQRLQGYLEPEGMDRLCDKFSFKGFIGDQDWWNLVVWDAPELVHPLPCSYNYQTTQQFNTGPWAEQFDAYHTCPGDIRVLHGHAIDGNKAKG